MKLSPHIINSRLTGKVNISDWQASSFGYYDSREHRVDPEIHIYPCIYFEEHRGFATSSITFSISFNVVIWAA